ncbi:Uncharacterized protein Rs2_10880 [Raphanus sativus]|uniref:Uncharacterized protein LOC108844185 n=1 Tax=Raphanus sativus TaxID=3726 RepID=A0A6J0MK85_RAPSA|nr:uncharacterized protein LOC108844185 [Raphanus sativus]XP_056853318.1 uncharacterized protein LOC130502595 [Raphanus sativus]XP_056860884.1 uncharacterized protein LOC130509180 [Raphanus sativus]XP_056863476.1 uncharacterized protein LOC130510825 [Raphanus sativus]KAJ4871609.1 Uncharacterized protein Rs2_46743 [Raphanus sativus]KAJ4902908.1 Uncharacterized protein Rs2_16859 [Raphanus sativus]KAJ4907214.1 Uncharacterized protein Rs2_10872 [Raphanus sativus]KAJ4907222.1 Uncharacterized prot
MESVAIPEHSIKLLHVAQPGVFDLVGYVISAGEGKPYQSVFYNGIIEVVKQGKIVERHGRLDFQWLALVDPYRSHPDIHGRWDRLYKDMNRLVAYYKGMTTWLDGLMHLSIHLRPRFFSMVFLLFTDGRDWGEPMKSCKSRTQPFYGRKYSGGSPVAWVILNKVMRRLKKPVYLNAVKILILVLTLEPSWL